MAAILTDIGSLLPMGPGGGDRSLRWVKTHGRPYPSRKPRPLHLGERCSLWHTRKVDARTSSNSAAHTSGQDRGNNTEQPGEETIPNDPKRSFVPVSIKPTFKTSREVSQFVVQFVMRALDERLADLRSMTSDEAIAALSPLLTEVLCCAGTAPEAETSNAWVLCEKRWLQAAHHSILSYRRSARVEASRASLAFSRFCKSLLRLCSTLGPRRVSVRGKARIPRALTLLRFSPLSAYPVVSLTTLDSIAG